MKRTIKIVVCIMLTMILGAGSMRGLTLETRADDPVITHDGDEIRALLASDGDVAIKLDGDVEWRTMRMTDRAVTAITLPGGYNEWHTGPHDGYMQTWVTLGSGSKSLDLAGHDMTVAVEEAGTNQEEHGAQLYMIDIPSGASFTVDDSSGKNKGEILFDGYLHSATKGAAGTHESNYENDDVVYRHVFRVSGGGLIFNGGEIATRRKLQYISIGLPWNTYTAGPGISRKVSQQVNCVGITMLGGSVVVNGGIISGRGYRFMYSGALSEGLYEASEYFRAAAIYAEGGDLVINDGTFNGMGCADTLNVFLADSVKIRTGFFHTHKVDDLLVPSGEGMDGGATGNPRYMTGSYGNNGLWYDMLNNDISDIVVDDSVVSYSNWTDFLNTAKDVTVTPNKAASIARIVDEATGNEIDKDIKWDGTSSRKLRIYVNDTYTSYPWRDNYYEGIAESAAEALAVSATVVAHGHTYNVGGDTVNAAETVKISPGDAKTMLDTNGYLTVDLLDLLPSGMTTGDSFALRLRYMEHLMPYNGDECSGTLTHSKNISVSIEPAELVVTVQPENMIGDGSETEFTLHAESYGATSAWWEEVWPDHNFYKDSSNPQTIFNPVSGEAEITIPYDGQAHYYKCWFYDGFSLVSTDIVCARKAINLDIFNTNTDVVLYKNLEGGDALVVTGDLYDAFYETAPEKRSVTWYKDNIPVTTTERVKVIASTPHLNISSPQDSDAGTYYADVTIDYNGESRTFSTGTYNVTVEEMSPTMIQSIELFGIGDLYLGDIAPGKDDVYTGDPRYYVEDVVWAGASAGSPIQVPTASYTIYLHTREDYTFEHGGAVPVTLDGKDFGTAGVGQYPGTTAYVTYAYAYPRPELTARNAITQTGASFDPGEVITDFAFSPSLLFNATGQVYEDPSVSGSEFSSSDLPEWITLTSSGGLGGTVPTDIEGIYSSEFTYKTSMTGDKTLNSAAVFMVRKVVDPAEMAEDAATVTHAHTWDSWTDNGDNSHSHKCSLCGVKESGAHSWDDGAITTEATKDAPGVMTYTCEDCGATKTKPVPYETHNEIVFVEGTAATCLDDGIKDYYVCEECGVMFWDEYGEESFTDEAELVIPATGHDWGAWTSVKTAQAGNPGSEQRVCKNDSSHVETRDTYLISYDLDGGTLDGKTGKITVEAAQGTIITIIGAPAKSGYTFSYWKGSSYKPGDKYTVEGEHTFTAQWVKDGNGSGNNSGNSGSGGGPGGNTNGNSKPKTGDNSRIMLWFIIAFVAAMLTVSATALTIRLRRRKQ